MKKTEKEIKELKDAVALPLAEEKLEEARAKLREAKKELEYQKAKTENSRLTYEAKRGFIKGGIDGTL